MLFDTKSKVIEYINLNLKNYDGFVQFSNREFKKDVDLFIDKEVVIEDESGFISEAYFYNKSTKKSVSIKMLDGAWYVDEVDLNNVEKQDIQIYKSLNLKNSNLGIKMAQIWEEESGCAKDMSGKILDEFKTLSLKKVVFMGLQKGEENENNSTI